MKMFSTFWAAVKRQILADTRSPQKVRSLAYSAAKSGDMKSTAYGLGHGVPAEEFPEIASMVRACLGKCPIEDEIFVAREMAVHTAIHLPAYEQNWTDHFVFAVEKLPKAQDKFEQYKTALHSLRLWRFGGAEVLPDLAARIDGSFVERMWQQGLNCIKGIGEREGRMSAYKTLFLIRKDSVPHIQNIFPKYLAEIEAMPTPTQRLEAYCDLTLWNMASKASPSAEEALFTHIIRESVSVTDEAVLKRTDKVRRFMKSSLERRAGGIKGDGFVLKM